MLYVKMMSGQNLQDNHQDKNFTIYHVNESDELSFDFLADGDTHVPALFISKADGTVFEKVLTGNVYIMNEAGKTIASHGC